jgi:hypothetical protein
MAAIKVPPFGDVRMPEPLLHLGDVCPIVEGVGGCGGSQGMCPDLNLHRLGIPPHGLVDPVRRHRLAEFAREVILHRSVERPVRRISVP